jgi:hypothetical protein
MDEVTVSLIILSVEAMKALCRLYGFLLEGSFGPDLTSCLHTALFTSPGHIVVMELLGLISNHLVSLYIISPEYGLVYTIGVCIFGYDGYYAKVLALRLISISWLHFISSLLGLIGENREGDGLRVMGVIYWPMRDLCSSVHILSYLLNSLLVLKIYVCYGLCVHRMSRRFSLIVGG